MEVSSSKSLPLSSITLTVTISILLALINIGSSVALDDILSMAVSGTYLSYLMVSILLFYRRIRGHIGRLDDTEQDLINVPGSKLVWGPFHCPGVWGISVNFHAISFTSIVIFFSFWPSDASPNVQSMNWSVLGIGASSLFAVAYYFMRARGSYHGPVMELSC